MVAHSRWTLLVLYTPNDHMTDRLVWTKLLLVPFVVLEYG